MGKPHDSKDDDLPSEIKEVVRRVTRSVAKEWDADRCELEREGYLFAVEALRAFKNGIGTREGYVGCYVNKRLHDKLKHERGARLKNVNARRGDGWRRAGAPLYHLREGRQKNRGCDNGGGADWNDKDQEKVYPGEEFVIRDDPRRPVWVSEAAESVRHCLSSKEIEILRFARRGMDTKAIAYKVGLALRTVQKYLADVEKCVERHARETGLPFEEIAEELLFPTKKPKISLRF